MYEIKRHEKLIRGQHVTTFSREIYSANMLEVEAGTTGRRGGDGGHGGRTYFRVEDLGCTDMETRITHGVDGTGFEVILGGDCEMRTIITALKFIVQVLEEQIEEMGR